MSMYMPLSRRIILLFRSRVKALALMVLAIGIIEWPNLIGGEPTLLAVGLGDIFAILCLALPVVFASGVVSGDFRRGMARLWLQKPIGPVRFYLSRFLEGLLVSLVCALLALGATRLAIAALGQPDEISRLLGLPSICNRLRLRCVWLLVLDIERVDARCDWFSGGGSHGP